MVKITLTLLQILFATSLTLASKNMKAGRTFTHIGKFESVHSSGNITRRYQMADYFISNNPSAWAAAENDCRYTFGANTGLVAIESIAEWEFIREMLEQYGSGTTYWTSGLWDPTNGIWRWALNNQPLPPHPPWGAGFPTSPPNTALRIIIYHTSRYDAEWRTYANTQVHRYICEVRKEQC